MAVAGPRRSQWRHRLLTPGVKLVFLHLQTDFLIVVLRDVIQAYPEVRVVLMSATIDTSMFREYFFNCPIIEVFGRTFSVQGGAMTSSVLREDGELSRADASFLLLS